MPKGDRLKFKADPEDGTTPVSNLLLEAVAIANLNGTEKGIILYLWRNTYGWLIEGRRLKETRIPQAEVSDVFSVAEKTIQTALKSLYDKRILKRRDIGQGRGYVYSMNTSITEWNSHSIKLDALSKVTRVVRKDRGIQELLPLSETSTLSTLNEAGPEAGKEGSKEAPPLSETSTLGLTKMTGPTLYKESLNKGLNKDVVDLLQPSTPASKYLFEKTSRKRWANKLQREEFEKCEEEVGFAKMKDAIDWALTSGIHNIKSMMTAARKGKINGAHQGHSQSGKKLPNGEQLARDWDDGR